MDLNLRLIHARDFLKTSLRGGLDLEASKELLLKLASENAAPHQYDIMIDARQAIGVLTFTDITQLVNTMIEHRESFRHKMAILTSPGRQFDNAKFMQLYAGNRGLQVGAFHDFEEAMNWLMTADELTAGP